ncbi:MAG: type I 3-dehydroquinate dehydratase [Thermoplasmatota archaeon]
MHRLVATVHAPDAATATEQLRSLPPSVSLAEIRLDALWQDAPDPDAATETLLALLEAAPCDLLATLRPEREGGAWRGDEAVRLGLLAVAAEAGFQWIDLENDLADMHSVAAEFRGRRAKLLLSRHLFDGAPERDLGLRHLTAMQDLQGSLHKLAFPASAFPDRLRALELIHDHRARHGAPAVAPMGDVPASLRALAAVVGNGATYGHAPGAPPAAPGQPSVDALAAIWDHWGLDPASPACTDGWFCVIGSPVDHSLSPRIHNAALQAAQRGERFGALDVPPNPGYLRLLFAVAPRLGLKGCSITSPHKLEAARLASTDERVDAIGAANCVRFTPAGPEATNTDATALHRLLEGAQGPAVVLGAGGAARAALWALRERGIPATVCSRDEERGRAVAERFGASWHPYAERGDLEARTWVQATPVGSRPDDASPLAVSQLSGATVVEMVYAQGTTALERTAAEASAAHVATGLDLLVEQAVDAYRFWTGDDPDAGAMRAALSGGGG